MGLLRVKAESKWKFLKILECMVLWSNVYGEFSTEFYSNILEVYIHDFDAECHVEICMRLSVLFVFLKTPFKYRHSLTQKTNNLSCSQTNEIQIHCQLIKKSPATNIDWFPVEIFVNPSTCCEEMEFWVEKGTFELKVNTFERILFSDNIHWVVGSGLLIWQEKWFMVVLMKLIRCTLLYDIFNIENLKCEIVHVSNLVGNEYLCLVCLVSFHTHICCLVENFHMKLKRKEFQMQKIKWKSLYMHLKYHVTTIIKSNWSMYYCNRK